MKISIITLFPEVFNPVLNASILKRAQKKNLVEFELVNLRDFGYGKHKVVDDRPYGGGAGMILKPEILTRALKSVVNPKIISKISKIKNQKSPTSLREAGRAKIKIVLTSASGNPYRQKIALRFSEINHLIIICGHYEGVDQRFTNQYVDEEISIGDYVLTGGEIPAMAIIDSITRLIPGVLEKPEAIINESFSEGLLEHPQYTRPEEFEGKKVPNVLLSGNHAEIKKWRLQKSLEKTKKIRPDLLYKPTPGVG